jgi:hypothetical protein
MQLPDFIAANPSLWGATLTVSVTIFLFVVTKIIEIVSIYLRSAEAKVNLINGIYLEIEYNVKVVHDFLTLMPQPEPVIEKVLGSPNYIPHLTYANHTLFYGGQVYQLPSFPPIIMERLIEFYCNLESLKTDINALERKSFGTVSDRGGVIRDIWTQLEKTRTSGRAALDLLKTQYPKKIAR